ncbi:hypothetical protein HPB47_003828 [Ixodes persulcatus]|uniref:Uncharacterized protein n=1 Tax=Ixodes persulcatus TaxID=34615 RepID=A0AC60PHJ4_IXOPE|nr:hypothetical protein HPB47_003828 [Ixodes persulcatus]
MVAGNYATDFPALDPGNATSPIAPEAPAVPPVSTVAPPSPPDAAAAAAPPPHPSPSPSAPPEPSPTGLGVTSAEATDFVRAAAVVVGDTTYAAWSPASGDGEVYSDSDHLVIDGNPTPGGPASTPTDSMDTTTTETPDIDSSRLPHEDSKRPLMSSGSRSPDSGGLRATCPKKPRNLDVVHLLDAGPCFLVGNFNCVLDSYADVRGPGQGRSTLSARELRQLVRHFDLVDGWSLLYGFTHQSTWNRRASGSRIDRLYLPRTLSAAIQTCTAVDFPSCPEEISDHRPRLIKFCFGSAVARSSRPWRLDSRILDDETTRCMLGNLIKESLVGVRPEPASWDRLKGKWQSFITLMGRHLRERHRGLLHDTILRIRIVRRGGALTPFMRAYLDQLQRLYEQYLRLDSTASTVLQAQGSPLVHPEVLRYTHRTSLQAFERQQTPFTSGSPGRLDNGRFAAHFRSLAQSDAPVDRTSVSTHPLLSGLPKISAEDDPGLRRPPSATELWNVLKRMKNGSAPGPDGLPAEFYRTFWHILGNFVTAVVRVYFEDLLLPPSFQLGRIVLIPKEGARVDLPLRPFILQVRSALFTFFWNNRTELVRRSRLCLTRCEGGWSFPCIELAAPILALKTTLAILDDHDNPARPLTLYFLGANNRLLGDSLLSPLRTARRRPLHFTSLLWISSTSSASTCHERRYSRPRRLGLSNA